MFVFTEDDAAAVRASFLHGGVAAATIELRRRFPGIEDDATALLGVLTMGAAAPAPEVPRLERQARRVAGSA
jgi:hypothetical protein